ncbi:phage tail fiber protein [Mycobacteroides abscessus]
MAIAVATTRQNLADRYGTLGAFFGLATGNPGTSSTPGSEANGGSYARVATTWSSGSGGAINGTACTINANAGTYTHAPLCSAATGATMIDWAAIVSTILSAAGQIVLTPSYAQS